MSNDFTRAERTQLASVLGCSIEDLDERLSGFVAAAEEEYVRMMLGQHVYSRGQDIKVYRLSLLIKHAFGGRLPTEGQISALFQTTTTESRSLLRAVRAKFQYELRKATHDTMAAVFGQATKDDDADTWSLVCDSDNVIEALNDTVARHDGSLPKIRKARGTAGEYEIAASTYAALTAIL
jgi:class 3 adenylate cyclase